MGCHKIERVILCDRAGKTEYVNLITGEVVIDKPPAASITSPTPVSQDWDDYGTAMMPRAMTLRRMGRYDLHNAVCPLQMAYC